ncbi:hypothetical protein [Pseudomonas sp. NA-150]|uniref:hypothetical protein n=1 Tax=Pseudomonas sp. NA-150 TaxID=3367525 RepID=UPI0037C5A999
MANLSTRVPPANSTHSLQSPIIAMNIFSFRADAIQHVFELMLSPGTRAVHRLTILPDQLFPDVEVELVTDMTADELRPIIAGLDDAHVIADTFLACDLRSNPLQRGNDPYPFPAEPEY